MKDFPNLQCNTAKHDLDPEIYDILTFCQGNKVPEGNALHKTTLSLSAPRKPTHPFWSQTGLNLDTCDYKDSIRIEVIAYAASKSQAKAFAMFKMFKFLELIRKILIQQRVPRGDLPMDMVELAKISLFVDRMPTVHIEPCAAMKMASTLLLDYKSGIRFLWEKHEEEFWDIVTRRLDECLKQYPSLTELIQYYLVSQPHSLSFLELY